MIDGKMRIAFMIPSGIGTGYSGPGIFLKRLLAATEEDVSPVIYAGLRPGHEHDLDYIPHRWMRFTNVAALEQLKWSVWSFVWLLRDRNKYDVVHFHGTFVYKIIGAMACLLLRKPYVLVPLSANADIAETGRLSGNRFVKPLRRKIVERAAHGFGLGNSVAEELVIAGLAPSRVTTIYNPVSEEFFGTPSVNRFDRKHIVFIGILGDRKRALLVLDVIAGLKKREIKVKCSFYGPFQDADFEADFLEKVQLLDLNEEIQHFHFSHDLPNILLNSASLFLLPSKQEGIPGALVEAMAAGVPCVVTDAGSMGEVIRASNAGRIVEPNFESIVSACEELLSNSAVWQLESEKAREFSVGNFSSFSVAKEYIKTMRKLI